MIADILENNPLAALRERLIRDGSIVPKGGISTGSTKIAILSVRERIEQLLRIIDQAERARNEYLDFAISIREKYYSFNDDENENSGCVYHTLLCFLNIYRLLTALVSRRSARVDGFSKVRTGFYSAVKENMKNTP